MNNEKIITTIALRTIQIEEETIDALKEGINHQFCEAVETIFNSSGRVIVSGIGKSALIAKKIVATLNSTGTPAIFMHASDAIHGDLGMIRPEDIALLISKSGETSEIKVLVPLIKNLGNTLMVMSSNSTSYLSQQADFLLYTPVSKEADPNNLAPTASTTAQMVMGDALATSLLALRGFTTADFAQFHPGGSLGKQLYLRVNNIYPSNEKPIVLVNTSIRDTIVEITSKRLGATIVLDADQKIAGIITDGDLRRMLEQHHDFSNLEAKDIMNPKPIFIEANELAINALSMMRKNSITQLVVTENKKYVGFIHLHDLIREGLI